MGQVARRGYGVIILPKEVIKILLQSSKKTYNLRRRRVTAKVPRDFYIRQLKCMQRGLTRQYHP